MAEQDAEAAFFAQMRAMNEAAGQPDEDATDDIQRDSEESEYEPMQPTTESYDQQLGTSDSNPFASYNGDQNPSISTTEDPSRSVSRSSMQNTHPPPADRKAHQTLGGFVVDDDDGQSDASVASEGGQNTNGASANMGISQNHNEIITTPDVSIQNTAKDQGSSDVVQNGATGTVPNLASVLPDTGTSKDGGAVQPSKTLPAPSTESLSTPTASAPKARLPHDRVGILEDRIKDDPRGDLEAWTSLISEHQRRNKIDDARNVYERFFKLIPNAVRNMPRSDFGLGADP